MNELLSFAHGGMDCFLVEAEILKVSDGVTSKQLRLSAVRESMKEDAALSQNFEKNRLDDQAACDARYWRLKSDVFAEDVAYKVALVEQNGGGRGQDTGPVDKRVVLSDVHQSFLCPMLDPRTQLALFPNRYWRERVLWHENDLARKNRGKLPVFKWRVMTLGGPREVGQSSVS